MRETSLLPSLKAVMPYLDQFYAILMLLYADFMPPPAKTHQKCVMDHLYLISAYPPTERRVCGQITPVLAWNRLELNFRSLNMLYTLV